jgi:hypothetical protein
MFQVDLKSIWAHQKIFCFTDRGFRSIWNQSERVRKHCFLQVAVVSMTSALYCEYAPARLRPFRSIWNCIHVIWICSKKHMLHCGFRQIWNQFERARNHCFLQAWRFQVDVKSIWACQKGAPYESYHMTSYLRRTLFGNRIWNRLGEDVLSSTLSAN